MNRVRWLLILLGIAWGCASPAPAPAHLLSKLVILPVHNRTGDPLTVSGDGVLDRYVFHAETVTVADVLETEAGLQLREKGFDPSPWDRKGAKGRVPTNVGEAVDLAAQSSLGPLCLYLEIRRWEPEGRVHVKYVTVDVEASLIDAKARVVIWHSSERGPVPTPGEVLMEAAYVAAARKAVAELLVPLHPEAAPPR
jgi:hypothetical protein